ncbi:hypothetical protein [Methanocorpusculum sp. GPch4]|uniref:hypothetical protein n=1 Tax=Methanocorpusculum sp. GPch4 TaxID=2527877 RepID=UPI001ADE68AE|nr:hypothetical protein [Methanocorpusculum sp. GPch4]
MLNAYMIIVLDGGNSPDCQFIGSFWQGKKKGLFYDETGGTASLLFLKWCGIELVEMMVQIFIEIKL